MPSRGSSLQTDWRRVMEGSLHHAERSLADVLAGVVQVEIVPVDSHFFDDLGADSLLMAQFCSRVRKRADLPSVSMKDIYRYPTIRALAAALVPAPATAPTVMPAETGPSVQARVTARASAPGPAADPPRQASHAEYLLCGVLQALLFVGTAFLTAAVGVAGYEWIGAGTGPLDGYLRSVLFGGALVVGLFALPIGAKWLLIGRWRPQEIRIWSLGYVRFWLVKSLVQKNPLVLLLVGSPLYPLYLRALGAKIGPGVAIFSKNVPVCTDLLTIGPGTVISKDTYLNCYRGQAGLIQTGTITLGTDVFVGQVAVLDIETVMGDHSQLGHTSSLHTGQRVPAGECWHGSPAEPAGASDYRSVAPVFCGTARRVGYSVLQLVTLLGLTLPMAVGGLLALVAINPSLDVLLDPGRVSPTTWTFYGHALEASLLIYVGALVVGLSIVVVLPRALNRTLTPGTVYPLYGFHYGVQRTIARISNAKTGQRLFGDSSYIVRFLLCLGYKLRPVEQTGSNFGLVVKHENPFLCSVGRGTVVADGLSFLNTDYSSTSFRVSRVRIGAQNFIGNNVAYPSQGRTGDNCLLATKVMIPIDGEIREGVGLLGSPCFEIPRTVARDGMFDLVRRGELRRRLAAKDRHNRVTIALHLLVRWMYLFGVLTIASTGARLYPSLGTVAVAVANIGVLLFTVAYFVLVERAVTALAALRPLGCSIYDIAFWRHERFWKVPSTTYLQAFNGTPFKNVIWRLLGVRLGHRVFDDGCEVVEKSFVSIGDDCTLNVGSVIQTHSQEDGAFKSDRSSIGAGCTLGVGAFVHYGVTMGDGAALAADSFLMKGEEIPPHIQWGGNPARDLRDGSARTPDAVFTTAPNWLREDVYADALPGGRTRWER